MVAPNNSACGNSFCEESGARAPTAPRELIIDPATQRGFVFSTDQTAMGRPEFLFLDTPAIEARMMDCSAIVSGYEGEDTAPSNMAAITKTRGDGPELSFVARVLTSGDLKKMLETNYLYKVQAEHGLIVMIPTMSGAVAEEWGCGDAPIPTEITETSVDAWIQAVATRTGALGGRIA